jgi:uncharacterized protein YjgD (DUF1641 family)
MLREESPVHSDDRLPHEAIPNADLHDKLDLLLDKVESLERRLTQYETMAAQAPGLLAMFTDTVDEFYKSASASGVDVEQRVRSVLVLLEKLSQPEVISSLTTLTQRLPMLADGLEQAPGLIAMAVDTLDELYAEAKRHGVDLETFLQSGISALKILLESGVLHPQAIEVVGNAGYALVESQKDSGRVGLFGLLRLLGDPDIQRASGFLVAFAKHFGQRLNR